MDFIFSICNTGSQCQQAHAVHFPYPISIGKKLFIIYFLFASLCFRPLLEINYIFGGCLSASLVVCF